MSFEDWLVWVDKELRHRGSELEVAQFHRAELFPLYDRNQTTIEAAQMLMAGEISPIGAPTGVRLPDRVPIPIEINKPLLVKLRVVFQLAAWVIWSCAAVHLLVATTQLIRLTDEGRVSGADGFATFLSLVLSDFLFVVGGAVCMLLAEAVPFMLRGWKKISAESDIPAA